MFKLSRTLVLALVLGGCSAAPLPQVAGQPPPDPCAKFSREIRGRVLTFPGFTISGLAFPPLYETKYTSPYQDCQRAQPINLANEMPQPSPDGIPQRPFATNTPDGAGGYDVNPGY